MTTYLNMGVSLPNIQTDPWNIKKKANEKIINLALQRKKTSETSMKNSSNAINSEKNKKKKNPPSPHYLYPTPSAKKEYIWVY